MSESRFHKQSLPFVAETAIEYEHVMSPLLLEFDSRIGAAAADCGEAAVMVHLTEVVSAVYDKAEIKAAFRSVHSGCIRLKDNVEFARNRFFIAIRNLSE